MVWLAPNRMGACYSSIRRSRYTVDGESSSCKGVSVGSSSGSWKKIGSNRQLDDDLLKRKKLGYFSIERELNGISGRMFINSASDVACLYTQQGKKGTNQDAMIVWQNFSSRSDTIFCGVFDGHGPYGHMVAKKVRDFLPLILHSQWKGNSTGDPSHCDKIEDAPGRMNTEETASVDDEWSGSVEVEDNEKLPEMYLPLKQSMLKAFRLMDKELKLNPSVDCFCSGTTAVTLIKQGMDVVIGNVGDSRAVLATRDKDNSLIAIQLTVDLKPDLPKEAARIQKYKGRVFAMQDEPEVARVWLPNNDSPGLAMARAFGDFCLKDFGLISVPDVYYRHLSERDEFIILASDGVWDVLSNKEAVDVVASAPNHATAARALVDCAVRSWRLKYPTSKNDDCAVVCLFLEHVSAGNEALAENDVAKTSEDIVEKVAVICENSVGSESNDDCDAIYLQHPGTQQGTSEIVPVPETAEDRFSLKINHASKRSLAECISMEEDEEWSALEGVTRVNSLLSLPRFLSSDKRSTSWRKW